MARLFCLTGFLLESIFRWWHIISRSMPSISKCAQENASKFYFKNSKIISHNSLDKFLPSFSTLEGSQSSIGRPTRSSMGPVVASSSGDLGSIVSSRGPSLGGS